MQETHQIIGFTGTRKGCTDKQLEKLAVAIQLCIDRGATHAVHGDCVGADNEFSDICNELGLEVGTRPCTLTHLRAFADNTTQLAEPASPMKRNRFIVQDAAEMIACPPNREEIMRGSGTWATIRMAKKAERPLYIIYPDGSMEIE